MKKFRFLTRFSFVVLALLGVAQLTGQVAFGAKLAESSLAPYVVFVNGWQNCCVWGWSNNARKNITTMSIVKDSLPANTEIRFVPYSSFQSQGKSGDTDSDSAFLNEGADFINNHLNLERPLILIGHSYGGDSVLKLLPKITKRRRIQFVGVIDPVAGGGLRAPVLLDEIPSNVDYFFNRWQMNAWNPDFKSISGIVRNLVPFDARETNGSIPSCFAKICDQEEQSLAKNLDGSQIRNSCEAHEATCEGWRLPGCNLSGCWKGSNGTKVRRLAHEDMPGNGFLQTEMAAAIKSVLPRAGYFNDGKATYVTDGAAYCGFNSSAKYNYYRNVYPAPTLSQYPVSSWHLKHTGVCPMPSGYFNDGKATYYANGTSYCVLRNPVHLDWYKSLNPGPNLPRPEDASIFGTSTGACPMPSGYFNDGKATYYTNGTSYCVLRNPVHLDWHKFLSPGPNLHQVEDASRVGSNTGYCAIPSGYFTYNNATFYSVGDGTYCGLSNAQEYAEHSQSRPQTIYFGTIDRAPSTFMQDKGACILGGAKPPASTNSSSQSINTRALWFSNECSLAVKLAVHYLNQNGQWTTSDWADFTPGDSRIVAYIGAKEPFYYYAETKDSAAQLSLPGTEKYLTVSNSAKQYGFQKVETNSDASMPAYQKITCPGVAPSSAPAAPPVNPPSNAPAQSPVVNSPPPANSGDCPYDVCVTDIVVSPDAPKRRSDVTFTATFVNKATEPRYYEWLILVFDPNKGGPNKGFGESPHSPITVPPGVSTATITFPVVTGPGPCMNLYVQAGIHKSATEKPAFPGRDGPPLSKYLDVCP